MSDDLLEMESVSESINAKPKPVPPPDAPLELAAIEPLPEPTYGPPPVRRPIPRWPFVVLALAAIGAAGLYVYGRPEIPRVVRSEAASLARELEPTFYQFTDDDGSIHIVDDLEKVPPKYRARAERKR
jgi:hypothetical protein